jgi:uncharacterized protein
MRNPRPNSGKATIISLIGVRSIKDGTGILNALRSGKDVNTADSGGRTILMEAVIQREHELMRSLISLGADPRIKDHREWTAFHFAAQNSDLESARVLVGAGADVNAKDANGNNVIWRAVFDARGDSDLGLIKFLLDNGADPNEPNLSGINAVDISKTVPVLDLNGLYNLKHE